jgi:hypothetical protein
MVDCGKNEQTRKMRQDKKHGQQQRIDGVSEVI